MTTEAEHKDQKAATPDVAVPEQAFDGSPIIDALAAGENALALELVAPLHYSELADLLEQLGAEDRP